MSAQPVGEAPAALRPDARQHPRQGTIQPRKYWLSQDFAQLIEPGVGVIRQCVGLENTGAVRGAEAPLDTAIADIDHEVRSHTGVSAWTSRRPSVTAPIS